MTEQSTSFRCTIVSYQISQSDPSSPGVWRFVHRLTRECKAIRVTRPADELSLMGGSDQRPHRAGLQSLKRQAEARGITARILDLTFDEAIHELKQVLPEDIFVLVQPSHPLDRLSPGFLRIAEAALRSAGPTIYFPESTAELGDEILLAGHPVSEPVKELSLNLAQQSGLKLEINDQTANLADLRVSILARPPLLRPALVILDPGSGPTKPQDFMKFAAVTGVPILVYSG